MNKKLLLLSSSRVGNTGYLEHAKEMIAEQLGDIKELLFIPFAGVTVDYDKYTNMVENALKELGINVTGIHTFNDPKQAIQDAQAIAIGGGNTFHLLYQLYKQDLITTIQQRTDEGMPYIGWSAGSNVAGSTIRTTNDMPIIMPPSFDGLNLVPVQLNPHYTDHNPPGHNGETREQRLQEFMVLNPETNIIGIVEGSALKYADNQLKLIGGLEGFHFKAGVKQKLKENSDISHLLSV